MRAVATIFLVLLSILYLGNCAKILTLFPMFSRSHYILGSSLTKALAEKGHDVTMISSFGEKEPPKVGKNGSYRDIVVKEVKENVDALLRSNTMSMSNRDNMNPFFATIFTGLKIPPMLEAVFQNKEVQQLINSNEKFDVVIVEQFFNEAEKALAKHFEAPLIVFSTIGANVWINPLVGNPSPPSYIPNIVAHYSVPMTFCERFVNSLITAFTQLYYRFYVYPNQNAIIQKYIPSGPNINDAIYNTSLILLNSHTSINQAVPYVPNMIDIGGFHVKPPKKLPKDLQDFLDAAKEGVVYFSMGSNLKSAELPIEKREAILKTFSKLKEQVLWKWEDDVLPGQPPNVKLGKWLPQQDILAHPNVKLFITHGGYLSTTETIYHGVPILAIPIYGDQKLNSKIAVNSGYGLMLPYSELSEDSFSNNIEELLKNPKYKNNAKKKSELFHDRITSPMDTAIYWVEYVIRHKGAPHLRVAGLDLPWYQYYLLDVISVLAVIGLILLLISCYTIKLICRKLCSKSKKKVKKS